MVGGISSSSTCRVKRAEIWTTAKSQAVWPLVSSYTKGAFGWQSREAVVNELAALKAQRGPMMDKLASATPAQIAADPQLLDFARAQGKTADDAFVEKVPSAAVRTRQNM